MIELQLIFNDGREIGFNKGIVAIAFGERHNRIQIIFRPGTTQAEIHVETILNADGVRTHVDISEERFAPPMTAAQFYGPHSYEIGGNGAHAGNLVGATPHFARLVEDGDAVRIDAELNGVEFYILMQNALGAAKDTKTEQVQIGTKPVKALEATADYAAPSAASSEPEEKSDEHGRNIHDSWERAVRDLPLRPREDTEPVPKWEPRKDFHFELADQKALHPTKLGQQVLVAKYLSALLPPSISGYSAFSALTVLNATAEKMGSCMRFTVIPPDPAHDDHRYHLVLGYDNGGDFHRINFNKKGLVNWPDLNRRGNEIFDWLRAHEYVSPPVTSYIQALDKRAQEIIKQAELDYQITDWRHVTTSNDQMPAGGKTSLVPVTAEPPRRGLKGWAADRLRKNYGWIFGDGSENKSSKDKQR